MADGFWRRKAPQTEPAVVWIKHLGFVRYTGPRTAQPLSRSAGRPVGRQPSRRGSSHGRRRARTPPARLRPRFLQAALRRLWMVYAVHPGSKSGTSGVANWQRFRPLKVCLGGSLTTETGQRRGGGNENEKGADGVAPSAPFRFDQFFRRRLWPGSPDASGGSFPSACPAGSPPASPAFCLGERNSRVSTWRTSSPANVSSSRL